MAGSRLVLRKQKVPVQMTQMVKSELTVNGVLHEVVAHPDVTLLWILRDNLKLTGVVYGCGKGECGACTVHLDGKPALSCQYVAADIAGRAITTIEGLLTERAYVLHEAWAEKHLLDCKRCANGQIMRADTLLGETLYPTREQILEYMKPNDCHCGAGTRFVDAIALAAARLQSAPDDKF